MAVRQHLVEAGGHRKVAQLISGKQGEQHAEHDDDQPIVKYQAFDDIPGQLVEQCRVRDDLHQVFDVRVVDVHCFSISPLCRTGFRWLRCARPAPRPAPDGYYP
ncbi:hypothetical protein D9M68_847930 [compost metagenome]